MRNRFVFLLTVACSISLHDPAGAIPLSDVPQAVLAGLATGKPQNIIVLFDDREIEKETVRQRRQRGLKHDDDTIRAYRVGKYRELKHVVLGTFSTGEASTLREYDHLPMSFLRLTSRRSLDQLASQSAIVAIYENRPVYTQLAESLPLIRQPATALLGYRGAGTTVAILDTGINYTLSDFGSCTSPGVPAGCRVVASVDVTGNGVTLNTDPNGHGTNVSGIVAAVAPDANIASINVFSGATATDAQVIDGINWAIANQSTYNIVAMNMSLGDGTRYTSPCSNSHTNPYVTPIANSRSAGILPVVASGNNDYTNGISSPACTPGTVSVGAVYDSNLGGLNWGICTDATTAADQVACFSNSASFLTILAPGAMIAAAGSTKSGTSQATPHVSGAVAVLRAAFPAETLDQTLQRMTANGVAITDPRNGIVKPRLDMLASLGVPANDNLVNRGTLNGDNGQIIATNVNASKEPGEPFHAGNAGGRSVWWSWTPTATGVATLDTHSSDFDTLLAVYTGSAMANLSTITSNDNDGSTGNCSGLTFTAIAGTEYLIAVDGASGASGFIKLNRALNQQADLSIALTALPDPAFPGNTINYTATVTNNGPSLATNTQLTVTFPASATVTSIPTGCSANKGTVVCTIGNMTSGAVVTTGISVQATTSGQFNVQASVNSATTDPQTADNGTAYDMVISDTPPVPGISAWGLFGTALFLAGYVGYGAGKSGSTGPFHTQRGKK